MGVDGHSGPLGKRLGAIWSKIDKDESDDVSLQEFAAYFSSTAHTEAIGKAAATAAPEELRAKPAGPLPDRIVSYLIVSYLISPDLTLSYAGTCRGWRCSTRRFCG